MASNLEDRLVALLEKNGPLTGGKIVEEMGGLNPMHIWKICMGSNLFRIYNCARYYLRYDITREDQIRLSPSVLRDFLSFTLVYKAGQRADAVDRAALLANKHRLISFKKLKFARNTLLALTEDIRQEIHKHACCFIAGDISYFLSHEEPRKHAQIGAIIKGSDIDIIVVYNHMMDEAVVKAAEKQILAYKYQAIKDPNIAQEIDFLFKPVSKMLSQFSYSDIHQKIASKILYESFFLYGSLDLYEKLQTELEFSGTVKKIETDFESALKGRKDTIRKILALDTAQLDGDDVDPDIASLFYFSQERLEFT